MEEGDEIKEDGDLQGRWMDGNDIWVTGCYLPTYSIPSGQRWGMDGKMAGLCYVIGHVCMHASGKKGEREKHISGWMSFGGGWQRIFIPYVFLTYLP